MSILAYLDPGSGSMLPQLIGIVVLLILALALLFGLVKFVKWSWRAGSKN